MENKWILSIEAEAEVIPGPETHVNWMVERLQRLDEIYAEENTE